MSQESFDSGASQQSQTCFLWHFYLQMLRMSTTIPAAATIDPVIMSASLIALMDPQFFLFFMVITFLCYNRISQNYYIIPAKKINEVFLKLL